jgi:polyisoprenoid-binding protein YceI
MKKTYAIRRTIAVAMLALSPLALIPAAHAAENYVIDTKGMHASINFKIKHLGYSYLLGRFNDFGGTFTFDEANPANSKVDVTIKTTSLDSNHAERDTHLRGDKFLDAGKFPTATFKSTKITKGDDAGEFIVVGDLTLHGVTKPVTIEVESIGAGPDPWGGYRRGFEGETKLTLADFGIDKFDLGPASKQVELELQIEGVRQ